VHRFKGGGKGSVPFQTSEARGAKRSIVAEVIQDGIPRKNLTIARFAAPNPGVGPPRPRARTAPGHPDPRDLDQGAAGLLLRRLPAAGDGGLVALTPRRGSRGVTVRGSRRTSD